MKTTSFAFAALLLTPFQAQAAPTSAALDARTESIVSRSASVAEHLSNIPRDHVEDSSLPSRRRSDDPPHAGNQVGTPPRHKRQGDPNVSNSGGPGDPNVGGGRRRRQVSSVLKSGQDPPDNADEPGNDPPPRLRSRQDSPDGDAGGRQNDPPQRRLLVKR